MTLLSENFTVYLTWLPGLGNPPNVTYFVTYQGYRGTSTLMGGEMEEWVRDGGASLDSLHSRCQHSEVLWVSGRWHVAGS